MVAACFLERKPPDILFFGHKSFAEYLVAERLVQDMSSRSPSTDALGLTITPDLFSFVAELATLDDWKRVIKHLQQNKILIMVALDALL